MLDIRFIRENPEAVQKNAEAKGYSHISIADLLAVDDDRRVLQKQVDELREKRNQNAAKMKGGKPDQAMIDEGKQLKVELADREELLRETDQRYMALLEQIPNMMQTDVPPGGEEDSVEIKKVGDQPVGGQDHLTYATSRDWVDFERGAKVAGAKFYYLKGDLALLENAITQFALNYLVGKGFNYMTVPHLVNQRTMTGTGFAPRSSDQSDEYSIEEEDLSLIATAEIPLTGYHADEIIDEADLPLLYAGYSPCYRREAGAAGKHTRGLFRVHQFNKLEMYAYTLAENSQQMHERLLSIEEELWQALGIPYHVINIAAGDLGAPAAKKYDLEYWSPVDKTYRELTSCSNCTDFQTRNLNIRVRRSDGSVEMLHSLNGTAVSLARSLVAVMEHYQNDDGTLTVPDVLRPYMGGRDKI
ncbi:MAG TPA: serine--tRNA ligase [Patescibacteria group bacterium]|jgi:seryl-tRNA synthetase|nr:serine--tRNA ligase [Patescibacteria group bacterium]